MASGSAIIDGRRTRKELDQRSSKAWRALTAFSTSDRADLRACFNRLFGSVTIDPKNRAMRYEVSEETFGVASSVIAKQEPFFLVGPALPRNLSFRQFSTDDIQRYWRGLSAITLIHDLCFKYFLDAGKKLTASASLLVIERSDLLSQIQDFTGISAAALSAISCDLTYNPIKVNWTEPQYQPLIPLDGKTIAIAPLLVLSNNYERNYAALVEKIPWRKEEREALKSRREGDTLASIRGLLDEHKLLSKERVQLRDGTSLVGDIDLAIWSEAKTALLLLSLKWHYGPDSVAEVLNHSKRYQEANTQQRKVFQFANGHKQQVLSLLSIAGQNAEEVQFLPLILYQEDLPLEKDRDT